MWNEIKFFVVEVRIHVLDQSFDCKTRMMRSFN